MKALAAAVVGVVLLGSCATLQQTLGGLALPRVSVREVRSLRATPQGILGDAVLDLENPNAFPLRVQQVTYELRVDRRTTGEGRTVQPITVPAHGRTTVPVELNAPFSAAGAAALRFFTRGDVPYEVILTVHVATPLGPLQVPVRHEGVLRIPDFLRGGNGVLP